MIYIYIYVYVCTYIYIYIHVYVTMMMLFYRPLLVETQLASEDLSTETLSKFCQRRVRQLACLETPVYRSVEKRYTRLVSNSALTWSSRFVLPLVMSNSPNR